MNELDKNGEEVGRIWWYFHLDSPGDWEIGDSVKAGISNFGVVHPTQGHLHLTVQNDKFDEDGYINSLDSNVVVGRTMSPLQAFWLSENKTYEKSEPDDNGTLETAEDKGNLDEDNPLSFPDSLGEQNDQNDYFKFTLEGRNNLKVVLNNLDADLNVELLNSTGDPVNQSKKTGVSADLFAHVLNPGEYYIRVSQGVPDAQSTYQLDLKTVKLSGDVSSKELYQRYDGKDVDEPDKYYPNGVNLYHYSKDKKMEENEIGIENNKDTIVVIHGRGFSANNSEIKELLAKLGTKYENENYQVLALDWREPASDSSLIPYQAARLITPVAEWTKNTLDKLGINSEQITLIGHSLGSYVASEIGRLSGKVKSLVALDPAYPGTGHFPFGGYDLNGNEQGVQLPKDFRDVAESSVSFVVSDAGYNSGIESAPGDNDRAATADYSFIINYKGDFYVFPIPIAEQYHNDVIRIYADLIDKEAPKVTLDKYDNYGTRIFGKKQHEGVITANWNNNTWKIDENFDIVQDENSKQTFWA